MTDEPCRCWTAEPCIPHAGHCCFGYPDPDGSLYQHGQTPPCGHWVEEIAGPRPTQEASK